MPTRHFDLDQTTVVVMDTPILEYAQGSSAKLSWAEDDWTTVEGHHGSFLRARKPNGMAELTLSVMYGSPTNDALSARRTADRLTGLGAGGFFMKDNNGLTVAMGERSYVKKPPDLTFATEGEPVEWVFTVTGVGDPNYGSNRLA